MKRRLLIITSIFITVLCLRANVDEEAVYSLKVENFGQLTVVDGVRVDYRCVPDSAGWVVFKSTPDKASKITFENTSDHLVIQTTADEIPIKGLPLVTVYSSSLRKVENSGDSLLRVFIPHPQKNLSISLIGNGSMEVYDADVKNLEAAVKTGNGSVSVKGKANKVKLSNIGTGRVLADNLTADEAVCHIFGTGKILCNPARQLKIYGAGSGKIYFQDPPEKIINRSIGIKTLPMDSLEVHH